MRLPRLTEIFRIKESTPFSSSVSGEKTGKGWLYKVSSKDVYHGGSKPVVGWYLFKQQQNPADIKQKIHGVLDVEDIGQVGPENWEGSISQGNVKAFLSGQSQGQGSGSFSHYVLSGNNGPRKMPGQETNKNSEDSLDFSNEKDPDSLDFT